MWNLMLVGFLLTLATLFIVLFWNVMGVGVVYLVTFLVVLGAATVSGIRSHARGNRG